MSSRISSVTPQRAIEGGRITVAGDGFATDGPSPPEVRIGDAPARVVYASSARIAVIVPSGLEAGASPIRVGGVSGETAFVEIAAPFASGLHQVDSPVFDRDGNLYVTYSGTRVRTRVRGRRDAVCRRSIGDDLQAGSRRARRDVRVGPRERRGVSSRRRSRRRALRYRSDAGVLRCALSDHAERRGDGKVRAVWTSAGGDVRRARHAVRRGSARGIERSVSNAPGGIVGIVRRSRTRAVGARTGRRRVRRARESRRDLERDSVPAAQDLAVSCQPSAIS